MFHGFSRSRLVGFWFAAAAVVIASMVVLGLDLTLSTSGLLLTLSLMPPAILLFVWRGAPPPTVGEVLYAVHGQNEGRS
jgi:hypothetical protein